MPLTPDEIARRSFSPSADGYHQGEVQEYLRRVSASYSAMRASLPDGQHRVAELTLAIANHEQRLWALERRLNDSLGQLEATIAALAEAQNRASQQLAAARRLTTDQQSLLNRLGQSPAPRLAATAPAALVANPVPTARPPAAPIAAPTAPPAPPSPPPRPPAAPTARPASPAPAPATPAAPASAPPRPPAAPGPAPARLSPSAAPAARPPAASPRPLPDLPPAPSASSAAVPPLPQIDTPTIAESANDLLDGVLGDVMGNLTERPNA